MPEPKRPLKVFLCHAHADRDAVRALYTRLTKDGVDAWLDKEKLLPGQDWELEIRRAVREADVVVVCLSKQFNQAGFRQKEVRLALDTAMEQPEGEIFIIPARLEECDTLESLRKWHWVDLFEEGGYEGLIHALRSRTDKIDAILQAKRSWLPKVTTSHVINENVISQKKHKKSKSEPVKFAGKFNESQKPIAEKSKSLRTLRKPNTAILVALIGFAAIVIAGLLSSPLLKNWLSMKSVPTTVNTPVVSVSIPSTVTQDPHADSPDYIDPKGVPMRLVPAGEFSMGSDNGETDEKPLHVIYLDDFYIDKYEVTNKLYKACVDAGVCQPPQDIRSYTHSSYYGNPKYDNYPFINADWYMAKSYCEWRAVGLPTEAQWEKAARGASDARTYPWGEGISQSYANNNDNVGDTTAAGSYENGKSPYGVYDLAGNVMEWVADWYSETYYQNSLASNPLGPDSGTYRVLRGGAWNLAAGYARTSARGKLLPVEFGQDLGFRCAKDANP